VLEHLRRVEETGEELIVTDHGEPVLRIVPIRARTPAAESFAGVRGKVVYHGDLLEPTTGEWPEP
jgi:prevent-host-death family protein